VCVGLVVGILVKNGVRVLCAVPLVFETRCDCRFEIRPEVGLQAIETGCLLVGEQYVLGEYRTQFEREATSPGTHEQRI
jgi:hypothetical protein